MIRHHFEDYSWAKGLRDFALVRVVGWAAMIPMALVWGWAQSISFVTVLSLLALVLSDLAVYQGGRAEVAAIVTENADVTAEHADVTVNP